MKIHDGRGVDLRATVYARVSRNTHIRRWEPPNPVVFSTPYPSLNAALGIGGFPSGRIVELYGPESSGKSTLAMKIVRRCQALGRLAAFVDADYKFDVPWAERQGVTVRDLLLYYPETAQNTFDLTDVLLREQGLGLLVVDSIAALIPESEYVGDTSHADSDTSGLIGRWIRKTAVLAARSNVCVIVTNQLRHKVGLLFGNPETTPGGRALTHHTSLRVELRKIASVKAGSVIAGITVGAKVTKSSVAPPYGQAEFNILWHPPNAREQVTGDDHSPECDYTALTNGMTAGGTK